MRWCQVYARVSNCHQVVAMRQQVETMASTWHLLRQNVDDSVSTWHLIMAMFTTNN